MGGWRSGGRPSPGEDTDREQNVAKDREPDTRLAGGEGDAGREGNPVAIDVSIAGAATGRRRCGQAGVPMMEAADPGRRDDAAPVGTLHRSGLRGVLAEGPVSPGLVVVREIGAQHAAQVGVAQHHHVVEAFAA